MILVAGNRRSTRAFGWSPRR